MTLTPEQIEKAWGKCIDVPTLSRLLSYDPETGNLRWLPRTPDLFRGKDYSRERVCAAYNSKHAGKIALNTPNDDGYLTGRIWGKHYHAHRVAFAIHHGSWPKNEVDHINGDHADNRAENLRDVPREINALNRGWKGSSPMRGVRRIRKSNAWHARIIKAGKEHYLGSFATAEEAMAARRRAERELGFHTNHGRAIQ